MWDTRALEVFLFYHFQDCRSFALREYPHNPPFGVYREYVTSFSSPHASCFSDSFIIGLEISSSDSY